MAAQVRHAVDDPLCNDRSNVMPSKIDLEEIVRKNPRIDLQELEQWRELRRLLIASGMHGRRMQNVEDGPQTRAKLVDNEEDDPRLVRLRE